MANTTSSITGTVATDVVTFNTHNVANGVTVYVIYAKGAGTSATITFTVINPSQHATNQFKYWDSSSLTVVHEVFTFATSGNFRIALPLALGEDHLIATVAYTGGTDQTMAVDVQYGG